jgi:tetratricopeptide (TPR) repeat protein
VIDQLNVALASRYSVEKEIGRGGMASVWLARDLRHERQVAIKVLHPELAGAIGIDRFLREIRVTAKLSHPGIIPVLDSGTLKAADGQELPWYAMTYVPGESLRTKLDREGQLPIDEALRITREAATVLAAAHREGIIHRDIKPENILLSGGHVFVADFGLARALADSDSSRLTRSGMAVGTPQYMSPEQVSGDVLDARVDQYALASVLYEMLSGEPPFTGFNAQAIMSRRLAEAARPIRPVRSTVTESMETAVLKALERVPADRFEDVESFAVALGSTEHRARGAGKARYAALAILLVLLLAGWLTFRGRSPTRDPEIVALYERGVQGYDTRTPSGVVEGIQSLKAAIARDSTYAAAWAALARSYVRAFDRSFTVPGISRDSLPPLAFMAANRALELDSGVADAWLTRGITSKATDPTDLTPAIRSFRRSIALDSTIPAAWHNLAMALAESGDMDGGIAAWRRSVALDARYTQGVAFLALGHFWQKQFDSAAYWADSALALDPDFVLSRTTVGFIAIERGEFVRARNQFDAARRLSTDIEVITALAGSAMADGRAGQRKEALANIERAESLAVRYNPPPTHTVVYMAQAWAAVGDAERAIGWLRREAAPTDLHFQLHLRCDPAFAVLRADRRFPAGITPPPAPGIDPCTRGSSGPASRP